MLGGRKRASSSFGANVRRVGGDIVLDDLLDLSSAHSFHPNKKGQRRQIENSFRNPDPSKFG